MASLIIIYLTLFAMQRAISFVFADFPYTSILFQQVFGVFMPVLIFYTAKKEKYIEKNELKIKAYDIPIIFLSGFFMQFLGSVLNYPMIIFLEKVNVSAPKTIGIPDGGKILLYIFLICCLPAVFEEVLFRKFTFKSIEKYGKKTALIITAVIFGIVHFNLYSILSLIGAGLMLSYIIYKGYPLIYTMLFHFSLNFSGIILDYIMKNENVAEIVNNHFMIFGLISLSMIIMFILYISREAEKNV